MIIGIFEFGLVLAGLALALIYLLFRLLRELRAQTRNAEVAAPQLKVKLSAQKVKLSAQPQSARGFGARHRTARAPGPSESEFEHGSVASGRKRDHTTFSPCSPSRR
jgi:hypothetical protein